MSHNDYKEGWGVVDADGLNVATVSPTRRGAIVNWLFVVAKRMVLDRYTDTKIEEMMGRVLRRCRGPASANVY